MTESDLSHMAIFLRHMSCSRMSTYMTGTRVQRRGKSE